MGDQHGRFFTRRSLLQLGLLSAGLGWSCHARSSHRASSLPRGTAPQAEVIVVGAGIAGLAAAEALHRQGRQVLVLEGRNRLGGRIWTDRSLNSIPLDLGASWIHGIEGNPIYQLAQTAGIPTQPTRHNTATVYRAGGQRLSDTQVEAMATDFERLMAQVRRWQEQAEQDRPLQEAITAGMTTLKLTARQQQALDHTINTTLEHEFAADVAQLSLLNWDEGERFAGEDVLFPGGYGQILRSLTSHLSIQLGQRVTTIAHHAEGVEITTDKGVFKGDRAIITLPLGVLKHGTVQFVPPLPQSHQTAIQRLGMGVLNKVYLRFPRAFWDRAPDLINYVGIRPGEWAEFLNLYRYTQQPILLGFNAGRYGRTLEEWTDTQIVQAAMRVLRDIYGKAIPDPVDWLITRWQSDPWARGSYSFMATGASSADRVALGQPVGDRLFFAGEATSVQYAATVHGAFLSGQKATAQILQMVG